MKRELYESIDQKWEEFAKKESVNEDMKPNSISDAKKDLAKIRKMEQTLDKIVQDSKTYSKSTNALAVKASQAMAKLSQHLEKELK
jgi:hypothetical protein